MSSWDRDKLKEQGYKVNDRKLVDIYHIWRHCHKFEMPLPNLRDNEIVYSGAEDTRNPKLPNITFLPNIFHNRGYLMGTTFGHTHTQFKSGDIRPFQEIYEFGSCGAILLRSNGSAKLVLAKAKDKIIVGTNESMTIFNMCTKPLITLDYANPQMNDATKDLEKCIGPAMMIWRGEHEMTFRINPDYRTGNVLTGQKDNVTVKTGKHEDELYTRIKEQASDFAEAGIELIFGGNILEEFKHDFSKPLEQLVAEKNKALFNALQMP